MEKKKPNIDEFLKFLGVELTDYQKEIFNRLICDPDRKVYIPRGHGYSAARWLEDMFERFYDDIELAIFLSEIPKILGEDKKKNAT